MNETRSYIELEISKSHVGFYDFINKIDEHNIHITYTNSEEWFEQKLPMDVIDDFYNSALKTKMNSLPTIKFVFNSIYFFMKAVVSGATVDRKIIL